MTTANCTADRQKLRDLRIKQKLLEAELRVSHLERLRDQQKRAQERRRESEGWEQLTSFSAVRDRLRGPGAFAHIQEAQHQLKESGEAWEWLYGYSDLVDRLSGPERDLVLPISTALDRRYGWNWPVWRTWLEHARYRAAARLLHTLSGLVTGALKGLCSYVIGEGFAFKATARKGREGPPELKGDSKPLVDAVQAFLNDFDDANNFPAYQREIFICSRRDGEHFARSFVQDDGMTLLRTVLPEQVMEPVGYNPEIYSFGIRNDPDDLCSYEAYHVTLDGNTAHGEEVPADEIDFIKINVDAPVKRGFSDLCFDTYDQLKASGRLIGNMAEGGAVQASIAFIRQHEAATQNQVTEFLGATSDYQEVNPRTNTGLPQNVQQSYPGMVLDIDKGQEYVVPPFATNVAGFAEMAHTVLGVVAVRWNAPKWLLSSDTELNFASSLTVEAPFVKTSKAEQHTVYKPHFLRIKKRGLEAYCRAGKLRAGGRAWSYKEVCHYIEIQCEPPTIETRNKLEEAQTHSVYLQAQVESVQTVQQHLGLDPGQEQANVEEQQGRMGQQAPPLGDDPDAAGDDDHGDELADLLRGKKPPAKKKPQPTEEGEQRDPFGELLEAGPPKGGQFQKGGGRVAAQAKHDEAKKGHKEAAKAHKAAERTLTRHEAKLGKSAEKVQAADQVHREAKKLVTAKKRAAARKTAGKFEHKELAKAEKSALSAKSKLDKAKGGHKELRKAHGEAKKAHAKTGKAASKAQAALEKAKAALDALKAAKPSKAKSGAAKGVAAKSASATKPAGGIVAKKAEALTAKVKDAQYKLADGTLAPGDHAALMTEVQSASLAVLNQTLSSIGAPKALTKPGAVHAIKYHIQKHATMTTYEPTGDNKPNKALADESRPKLSASEASAVREYTDSLFSPLNRALREGEPLYGKTAKAHESLQAAFARAEPLPKPVTVQRGMKLDDPQPFADRMIAAWSSGVPVSLGGYISTTTNSSVVQAFHSNVHVEIVAKKGLDVRPHSEHPHEDEMLLDHNSRFHVLGVEPHGQGYRVKLEQVL